MRFWLEEKLRPPLPRDPWSRDLLSVALLLILASVLVPAWRIAEVNFLHMVIGQMADYLLLPALAFLLALRCGAIDLSVWTASGVGGVVDALLVADGAPVPLAFAGGAGAGLALGVANAVLVGVAGLPSLAVTGATAAGVIWAVGRYVPVREVAIPDLFYLGGLSWHSSPVLAFRVLTVTGVYLSVLLGLLMIDYAVWRGVRFPRAVSLFAALAAGGMISGLGGALWLLDHNATPVPTRLIDDLRIPAAAILAGGLFLGRRGRELLAGMSLPAALLIATIWRQKAWNLPAPGQGMALQLLVMIGMTLAVHLAFGQYVEARGTGRRLPTAAVLLTVVGIAIVAGAANFRQRLPRDLCHLVGLLVWLAAMPMIVMSMRHEVQEAAASEALAAETS